MSESKVKFELVSPERLVLSEELNMVVVPGAEGDFGVLPGHSPMISSVRPGVINTYVDGTITSKIFVAGGFSEVTGSRCTVLAEVALPVDEIDRTLVEAELKECLEEINRNNDPLSQKEAKTNVEIAQAKLKALDSPVYQ
ncbi:MAG: ATP synthase F1 subunit epsilon [Alphaproteobacteria bacterium]|nr:ATP synthase F1 subunit epsilon [Alphaproteobacteria bacterium]|tara:strand:- start:151 stop:570 length:420 start_codon:yes stop_codon:yes gene_type:complete